MGSHLKKQLRFHHATGAVILLGISSAAFAPRAGEPSVQDPASLCARIERVVAKVGERQLRSDIHTPWVVLHGVVAFGTDLQVYDADSKQKVNAVEYLLTRAKHGGRRLVREANGTLSIPRAKEVEHHPDQFLMVLADAGVSDDEKILADSGRVLRLADLLSASQRGFDQKQELCWTLVAYSTYWPLEKPWKAANGRQYRLDDIVRLAIQRVAAREPEGGTHHMYGVAYALKQYRKTHSELTDAWRGADAYLRRHIEVVRRFQQADGAFSDQLFERSSQPESPSSLAFSTGHTLEWLALACSSDELRRTWVRRAAARLCQEIENNSTDAFSDGGIYHAVHALRLYCDAVGQATSRPPGLP